jgi:hypothetical protein
MRGLMYILDVMTFNNKTLYASRSDADRLYLNKTTTIKTSSQHPERLLNSITTAALIIAMNGGATRT